METTIAGSGVLIPPEGLSRVDSPQAGMVDAVFIEAGSTEKGQVMMELALPDKALDLDASGKQGSEPDKRRCNNSNQGGGRALIRLASCTDVPEDRTPAGYAKGAG